LLSFRPKGEIFPFSSHDDRLLGSIECSYIPTKLEAGAMKRLTRIAILIFTVAIAPHCSFAAASSEVIISHASMSTTSIPLWVTQRQNFFGKYGIKSKVVWVRGNPAQIATLVSGDTQIAVWCAPPLLSPQPLAAAT
jgi:ABC-type nitrate/sulfonate/bicarbonate transport system substrate-binding protein